MRVKVTLLLLAVFAILASAASTGSAATSKKKIVYFGDSLAVESFKYASEAISASRAATVSNYTYAATSPCDWAKYNISGKVDGVIVETVGANMSTCQKVAGSKVASGSQAYWDMYERDLTKLMAKFTSTTAIWLTSPPISRDDSARGALADSNNQKMFVLMQKVAAARPNTFAVDAGSAVEDVDGSFLSSMPCLAGEQCTNLPKAGYNLVRAKDGLHFCPLISVTQMSVSLLQHCSGSYASGAWRFGRAQAAPVVQYFALTSNG